MTDLSKLSIARLKRYRKSVYASIDSYRSCFRDYEEDPEYLNLCRLIDSVNRLLHRKQVEEQKKNAPKFKTHKFDGDSCWHILNNK